MMDAVRAGAQYLVSGDVAGFPGAPLPVLQPVKLPGLL
jgi:hypothetical protein